MKAWMNKLIATPVIVLYLPVESSLISFSTIANYHHLLSMTLAFSKK